MRQQYVARLGGSCHIAGQARGCRVATGGRAGAGAHPVARTALHAVGRHDAGAAVAAAVLTNIGRSAVAENDPAPVLG